MRGLIILYLLSATYAADIGYEYQPVTQSDDDLLHNLSPESTNLLSQTAEIPLQHHALESPLQQSATLNPEFQKEFYSYTAPESSFDDEDATQNIANAVKRNLRVVFIKSPENKGFEEAALNLAKQASQGQTAIYVLSKQADIGALANRLQNLKSQTDNKPEVHFIKYRTAYDAVNAQKAIQEQYNNLPGSSQNLNERNAPVLNFASRAPVSTGHIPAGPDYQYLPANPISQTNDYLPPSLRHFRYRM